MMDILFWVAVGAFIGWNFPQPTYARFLQEWAVNKMRKMFSEK